MKNIIFIPNIDCGDGRNAPYRYSIKSYKKWAEQYDDIKVIEWTEPIIEGNDFPIIYQREWVLDILEYNDIDYNQVAVVDSDTIIHPDCPNFFEETNDEYSVVLNNGCYDWVLRGINGWGEHLFPDEEKPKVWEYHNSGFVILNKKHKWFQDIVKDFYLKNIDTINDIRLNKKYQNLPIPSTGQTIINFLLKKHKVNKNILPERYNVGDLYNKNLLHIPGYSWWPDELTFLDAGWIYHFNAIPGKNEQPRHVEYWMKRTYVELYSKSDNPLDSLLNLQKDKFSHRDTTSNEFKRDLISFFGDKYKDKDVYEVGANIGLTSRVLSFLFKKVYVNNHWTPYKDDSGNDWIVKKELKGGKNFKLYDVNIRNEINHNFDNINYIQMDSYSKQGWPQDLLKDVSVVFIDCIHKYNNVFSDVSNALKLNPEYIVFDDYGLSTMREVKKAVDKMIEDGTLKLEKKIGLSPGEYQTSDYDMKFVDYEGIICSIK